MDGNATGTSKQGTATPKTPASRGLWAQPVARAL